MTRPGDIVDSRFELMVLLGRGGMGEVWRARQQLLGRDVALKLLREEYSALAHLRRRFAREARAAARLSHENIASVYDFGQDQSQRMFIAMEYVEGAQLIEAVRVGMSVRQVVEVAYQLLDALAHAHARGVVHRDLKPENVIVAGMQLPEKLGTAKIVDFGIATLKDEHGHARETGHDQVVGTPLYMSPEQASGERALGPSTDLYSLGMILYELLSGKHPFESEDSLKVMSDQVNTPVPKLVPREGLTCPPMLEHVIMKALNKEPSQRWESAAKMRAALEPILMVVRRDEMWAALPHTIFLSQYEEHDPAAPTQQNDAAPVVSQAEPDEIDTRFDLPSSRQHAEPGPPGALLSAKYAPFVGRADQRDWLLALAEEVHREGRGKLVVLDGDAGVGKTRLAVWLKETLEERGLFRGHIGVFTRGTGNTLLGLQEVFESIFRTRGKSRERLVDRIELKLTDWGAAPVDEQVNALVEFLRPSLTSEETGQQMQTSQLLATLVHMLEIAAGVLPRLIFIDDLHLAGSEIVDWLEMLAVEFRLRRMPVMLIATVNSEDLGQNRLVAERLRQFNRYVDGIYERRHVGKLSEHEGKQLVRAILPARDDLTEVISERAAGNPLHLVMLLRYLSHEGVLELDERGQWSAPDLSAVRDAVPPGLAELLRVRLEQLDESSNSPGTLRKIIIRAAILGRRFEFDALAELVELEADEQLVRHLDEDFDALLSEGVIIEVVGRGDELYTFNYGVMRDFLVVDEVGPAQRRKLHRLAAQALERLYGDRALAYASQIAAHWHAGRKLEPAIEWYWRAGQSARRAYRQREALDSYVMCSALMQKKIGFDLEREEEQNLIFDAERFESAQVSRSRFLRTLVYAGDLHEGFGEYSGAEKLYRRVVKMCGKPDSTMPLEVLVPLCQAWLGLGHTSWQQGDFTAAAWAFQRVHTVLGPADLAQDIANSAIRGLARVAWHRGEYERAEELAQEAYRQAMEGGEQEALAESLWILGEIARMRADQPGALGYYERSTQLYESAQSPLGLARNLLSRAQLARYHKDFSSARGLYQEALETYERLRDRRGQGLCLNGLGEIERFSGNLHEARRHYSRALEIFEQIRAQYDVALTYTNLGLIELRARRLEAAERYLQAAMSLVTEMDYPYLIAGIGYNLALVQTMTGQEDKAEETLRPVLEMNTNVPISDPDFAEPLELLGRLRAREGSLSEAFALWERAGAIYRELELDEDLERLEKVLERFDAVHEEEEPPGA